MNVRAALISSVALALAAIMAGQFGSVATAVDASAGGVASPAKVIGPVDYNRDVRPILSDNCFACHGPDDAKRKAGLRLDVRAEAVKPAESGVAAVVSGKPGESELIKRLVTDDADEKMPPAKSHKTVTPAQIETLKRWVAEGAVYQGHWAFTPPVRPAVPAVKDDKWGRTPIDRFVLAKLDKEGLAPTPEADQVTLLRRLHLDLTGLPPTPAEVDAFAADASPDAYSKAVEKLLASPHYGERWGRHWLDAARYADSDGFEKDKPRIVHFYRDWVIAAFNRDLPYDRFVTEQLAGDLLPNATQDQVVATGYLRNSMVNEEGGVDPEQFRMDAQFDRMEAIGKGILGLTIQCAQCHTHKFDPIAHDEYYKLQAFLNNDNESQKVVYTPGEQMLAADLTRQMRDVETGLRHTTPDWAEQMAAWERTAAAAPQPEWTVLPLENTGDNSQRYTPRPDGSYVAQGYAPTKFTATFKGSASLPKVTAVRLELLTDADLPCDGPGRSLRGTCALSEFRVETEPGAGEKKRTPVKIASAAADFEEPAERELEKDFFDKSNVRRVTGPVKLAIDGDGKTAWGIDTGPGRRNVDRKAVFTLDRPVVAEGGKPTTLFLALMQNHGGWNSDDLMTNNLGRFRVSVTAAEKPAVDPLPKRVREILAVPTDKRTDRQQAEVFAYWRTTVPQWKDANDKIDALWKQWPAGTTSFTLSARAMPRATAVLDRGDWLKPTKKVTAGVPAVLNPLPAGADGSRLTLARWLTDDKAPTTARVFVNRIWQQYFGLGLVSTSEDFGVQSEPPSHPELLDWLAVEFMHPSALAPGESATAEPWSIKHVHRLIVHSAAYRQGSRVTPDLLTKDPYNRLLARASRFRVDGEIVRDLALAAGGLLNEKMGGKSVMPPAPAFLFLPPTSYAPFPWVSETGPEKYRRAVYTYRRRTTPYPVLQAFDVPTADVSCVRRLRSNSPLQALAALNEPIFVECAGALGKLALTDGGTTDADRVTFAFRRAVARVPTAAEVEALTSLLGRQRARFESGEAKAAELLTGAGCDPAAPPKGATANEWAAQTAVARVVLNLDEAITRE